MPQKYSLFLSLLICCAISANLQGRSRILVKPEKTKQKVTLYGGDMERSSGALLSAANPEQVANWAFRDIKFNVCRVQFDKNQEMIEGASKFEFYAKQVKAMKLVQQANPEIEFFATQRSDYNGYKEGDGNNFPTWIYDPVNKQFNAAKHGRFLADYVIHMDQQGVPIRYLSTGKEITQILNAPLVVKTIEAMHSALDAAKVARPLMVEPGAWSLPQAVKFIERVEKLGKENLFHAFASHNYKHHGEEEWLRFVEAANRAGAEAWNSESGIGHVDDYAKEAPFDLSVKKMTGIFGKYRAGIQGEIFFELWSRGIARETRSIYFKRGKAAKRMRSHYLMKQWTNSIADATIIEAFVSGLPGIDTLAFRRGNQIYLWITNSTNESKRSIPLRISKTDIALKPISTITWSNESSIEGEEMLVQPIGKKAFKLELIPNSITFAKIELE